MNRRREKQKHIAALKGYVLNGDLTTKQAATFTQMFQRARTEPEFKEVHRVLHDFLHGWKTGGDQFSHLLRAANELDGSDEDSDDSPAMQAALARSQITFGKGS